ncbi:MAG: response regulator, partial [Desulfobacterales bacterium]|nr:response regulator [Desulfobacterales bacterium]
LMPRDAWESHYADMLSLHEELAEVEFLNGANEKVEASLDLVIQKSKDIFDSARAHQLKITYLSSTGRLRESLDVTVHALKLLGFKVPRQPSQMTIIKELIKTRITFLGKDQETLENAPKTSSREFEAIMNIMSKAFSPAYIHEPRFFAMLNARIVRQSIRRGYASSTVMAYSAYGIVLNGVLGDVKNAYNFGLLALKLIEKLDASDMAGRCLFIFYVFIQHWLKPIREMNAPLMEAAQKCMEVGDLEYFGYCMGLNIQFRIHSGENLEKLIKDYARYHLPLEQANIEIALSFVRTCGFFLYSIRDESRVEGARLIENYDEEAEGLRMAESSHFTSLCFHHLYKGIRLYLFGEYQRALGCFDKVDKLKEAISSMYASPINTFYSALALCGARRRDSHKGKRRLIAALNKKIRLLKKWAKNGPANYENKLALARAERAGVQGRREAALNLYDLAIRKAGENGFIQEEAIANECAGAYLLRSGRRKYAALHIREAALIYNKWGAKRVAEQLLERYSDLVGAPSRLDTETESIVTTIRGFTRTSSSFTSSILDMETVMKAAMAISEEIDLGRFLKKMMKIITENTGAQNGTLILKHGERFLIQARMESATDAVEVFQKAPFEQSGDLPVSIVQYVSRTKELVLYAIDAPDEQFTRDEYIRKRRPKSILCLPIFHQNAIIGVLYLENNITANAFTEDRVQILEILLSQAAVSLQNAKLFEKSARAEEALLESKERLSMALDVSAAAVWEWEIGSDRLFFDDIDVIHDILGSDQKDLPETFKEFQTRIDPAHLDEMNALLSAYLRGKTPAYLHEHRVLKKDGEWTWVQDRAKVVEWDEDQRPVRLLGTSIDITERKEAEEEKLQLDSRLRQAQKMEAIGTLAGGIAHDFNNILFGALGFAEMIQENVEEGGRAALCAEQIMIALKRAADLVSQILTFSRQTEHKREPLRMQLVVKEALKLLRGSIPSTIEIVKNIDEECGPVLADPTQIHQVVMNLCTNAYHAMRDKGGVMRVELEEVEVGDERRGPDHGLKPGRHALLTVSDTGHGMDEDTQKRIFEPYFTTKKVGEGTGLGLATVHGIVKNHGGAMHVYSLVGQGTTFELFFPLFLKKGEVERTENLDAGLEGDEKILFVDDEEQIILFVKMALRDLGYDVRAHQNSAEALEEFVADPRRFDVVVTDQTMPHLTGEEMARRMLEIRPDLPIVLCSGFNEVLSQKKALELGIREYIRKPVLTRELARAIRRALAPAPENAEKAGSAGDTGSAGEDGS